MAKRIINVSVLPGEPLDGSGKSCIHLFVRDEKGSFVEPHVLHPAVDKYGNTIKNELDARPTRGRLACDPRRQVAPVKRGNVITVTQRTESADAVTCLKCKQSKEYRDLVTEPEAGS